MKSIDCVHVVPHIHDEASGPSYSVPRLCQSLAARGHQVRLICLAAGGQLPGVELEVHAQWAHPRGFAVSPSLARALRRHADAADIVHNHSLWSMANVAAGWSVPGRRAKLVTSPRGTLSRWALDHSRWLKRGLWPLQRRALVRADLLHATSQTELEEIRALGLRAPVTVVPNGVDIPLLPPTRVIKPLRTLLFLSRIHPKKGIDQLLAAWQSLQGQHPDWQLVIAGRGDVEHVSAVTRLSANLALRRVEFPGPVYGADKSLAYASADLFVLPTHSENFGMVVAEALAHGCPSVVSRGAPWSGLNANACGWWVENDAAELASTLDQAMRLSDLERATMGANGRAWMQRDFSWDAVAQRMTEAYDWTLRGGPKPDHVSSF